MPLPCSPQNWPNFAPNGCQKEEIALNFDEILRRCPKNHPLQVLHSGQIDQHLSNGLKSQEHITHIFLLGAKWSLEGKDSTWTFEHGQEKIRSPRKKGEIPHCIDNISLNWCSRQIPEFKAGLFLSYEAGWDLEEPRPTPHHKASTAPFTTIFCPLEIIVCSPNSSLSIRDRQQESLLEPPREHNPRFAKGVHIKSNSSKSSYLKKAHRVIQHIRDGNSFQVNLSQAFSSSDAIDFRSWCLHALKTQGAHFSGLMDLPSFKLMSLSPERLLKGESTGKLITRPIAGTLPKDPSSSKKLEQFKTHPKELAEHNMLIDLERNDLGKVCEIGSVQVEEYLAIETLPHVHHLVSQVVGQKNKNIQPGTAIFATFPGGTITGCPKLETMHILRELEEEDRFAYTGSMGYLAPDHFDTNILIRSATIMDQHLTMRFGGGIVWDSDPEKEYLETLAKAKGLFRSLIEGGAQIDPHH